MVLNISASLQREIILPLVGTVPLAVALALGLGIVFILTKGGVFSRQKVKSITKEFV